MNNTVTFTETRPVTVTRHIAGKNGFRFALVGQHSGQVYSLFTERNHAVAARRAVAHMELDLVPLHGDAAE